LDKKEMEKLCIFAMTKVYGKIRNSVAQSRFLPQKCAKTHPHASAMSRIFPGVILQTPVKIGRAG
jgi:hypothetical protein